MRRIGGAVLAATGVIACPCHLPLTLPVLVAAFGDASSAASLLGNTGLLTALLVGYFVLALLAGLRLLAGEDGRQRAGQPRIGGAATGPPAGCACSGGRDV